MQLIQQDTRIDQKALAKLLTKYGNAQFKFNIQAINDDVERLKGLAEQKKNKTYVKNCWKIIDYLTRLQRAAGKGDVSIVYRYDGRFIKSIPIEIRKFRDFNIQTTDYIYIMDKSIVTLDYSKLMDGIAMDIGYIDLGYDREKIESILGEVGIVASYDYSNLGELIEEDNYRELYNLRIDDSDYLLPDKKHINDYFGEMMNDRVSYIETLDSSSRKAMSIVVSDVLTEALNNRYEVQLVGVYEDSLVLMVPNGLNVKEVANKLAKTEVVRLFGRKFSFSPTVQIY